MSDNAARLNRWIGAANKYKKRAIASVYSRGDTYETDSRRLETALSRIENYSRSGNGTSARAARVYEILSKDAASLREMRKSLFPNK